MRRFGRSLAVVPGVFVVAVVLFVCATSEAQVGSAARPGMATQTPPLPASSAPAGALPPGREVIIEDGDRVVFPIDARVQTIARYEGQARIATDATRKVLVVLVDFQSDQRMPDGIVDWRFRFTLEQPFPFEGRWEGFASIDDARPTFGGGRNVVPGSFRFRSAGRTFDVLRPLGGQPVAEPDAAAIRVVSLRSSSSAEWASFDDAEAAAIADAPMKVPPPPTAGRWPQPGDAPDNVAPSMPYALDPPGIVHSILGGVPDSSPPAPLPPPPGAPFRVGGNIKSPVKLVDAKPVMPTTALYAGIRGVVILELTIDTSGSVSTARVLRSIPLLDAAALEAVKQWKYAPTLLNGVPVPVVITVTVSFP